MSQGLPATVVDEGSKYFQPFYWPPTLSPSTHFLATAPRHKMTKNNLFYYLARASRKSFLRFDKGKSGSRAHHAMETRLGAGRPGRIPVS